MLQVVHGCVIGFNMPAEPTPCSLEACPPMTSIFSMPNPSKTFHIQSKLKAVACIWIDYEPLCRPDSL